MHETHDMDGTFTHEFITRSRMRNHLDGEGRQELRLRSDTYYATLKGKFRWLILLPGSCTCGTHHQHDLAMKLAVCISFPLSIANQATTVNSDPSILPRGTSLWARHFNVMSGILYLHNTYQWSGSLRQHYFKEFSSILHAVTKNERNEWRNSQQQDGNEKSLNSEQDTS
jgi:hypothetical protein